MKAGESLTKNIIADVSKKTNILTSNKKQSNQTKKDGFST